MNNTSVPAAKYVGGQGSALVLLHGIGGTWEIWKPVLPALQARHRVIALTLPGHHGGPAYVGSGDATVSGLADQIIASLRALGVERAHVVGNSLGGWLAIELARRGFARSVIALSPAGGWRCEHDYLVVARSFKIVYALVDVIRFLLVPIYRCGWLRKTLMRRTMEHGERIQAEDLRGSLCALSHTKVLPGLLRTMGRDGPVTSLAMEGVPIRIAWSERDRVIPYRRYGEPLVERIHGAEVTMVSGAGHVPMYDSPERVVANILEVTGAIDAAEAIACRQSPPAKNVSAAYDGQYERPT